MEWNNTQNTLVFATNNANKVKEIKNILPKNLTVVSLKDINITEDIPETGNTFAENAFQKAEYVYKKTGLNCFADDSGLVVEALNGKPGVKSARYAGADKDDAKNIEKLLQNLQGVSNRKAKFVTVIALILNGKKYLFEGEVAGTISDVPKGEGGFGYDPVFISDAFAPLTFAEIPLSQKNKISHRSRAVKKLVEFLAHYSEKP